MNALKDPITPLDSMPSLSASMPSSPLLSIIVPCYNVANFVTESLRSILETTSPYNYDNVELIIINDGAKDETPQRIEQFIDTYLKPINFNYHYISQANSGLSQARNNGIAVAKGEYVYFFDSDDLLVNHAIDRMIQALQAERPDILEFDARGFAYHSQLTHPSPKDATMYQDYFDAIMNVSADTRLLQVFEQFGWYVWSRCYKKSLFANHQFEARRYFEDMMIVPYFYLENTHITSLSEVLIGYRQNPHSITANLSLKHLDDIFFALTKAIDYSKRPNLTRVQRQAIATLQSKIWRTIIMVALKQRIYFKDASFLPKIVEYKKALRDQYGIREHWHVLYFSGKIGLAVYRKSLKKLGLAARPPVPSQE